MLGQLIGGFIVILVGVSLAPTVANEVVYATNSSSTGANVTGAANTVAGLTTLFYCLAIASAGISLAAIGLRKAGLMGI
jgi:hypothetical protein